MAEDTGITASKPCKACGVLKALEAFPSVKGGRYRGGTCNECVYARRKPDPLMGERTKAWRRANPERHAELKKAESERARRRSGIKPLAEYLAETRKYADEIERRRAASRRKTIRRAEREGRIYVPRVAMTTAQRIKLRPWSDPALSRAEQFAMRYKLDPEFNLQQKVRTALRKKRRGWRVDELIRATIARDGKSRKIESFFGYSIADLRRHLEALFAPDMNWQRFCAGQIHIDHRRPLSTFDLTDPEQLRAAWQLSNLRPLWAADNLAKGARWEPEAEAA